MIVEKEGRRVGELLNTPDNGSGRACRNRVGHCRRNARLRSGAPGQMQRGGCSVK